MSTNSDRESKLIRVGYPMKRIKVTFRPTTPTDEPMKTVKLTLQPVPIQIGLRLTPGPDSDRAAVSEVFEKVFPRSERATPIAPEAATVAQFLHELEGLGYRFELMVEPPVSG